MPEKRIEVHRDPDPEHGSYRDVRAVAEGLLAPDCFPDIAVDVGEFLS